MTPYNTVRALLLALAALMVVPAGAQDDTAQLEILPRGSYFEILGPMSIRGRDVIDIPVLPDGVYRVEADGMGLASLRTRFEIDRGGLRPVGWSGPTSMLMPPGLDHLQKGESRGWFHLLSGAIGGAFLYKAVDDYGDAADGSPAKTDARTIRNLWTTYFATSWISASLESWLLTPEGSSRRQNGDWTFSVPRADRWDLTFRSVLVPGAGQRFVGRDTRANMFTTLFAVSAAAAITTQDLYLESRRERTALLSQLGNAADETERAALNAQLDDAESDVDSKALIRWIAVSTTAYVYLWNVFDAFSIGRQAERSAGPQMVASPTQDGVALSLSWSFH